MKRIFFSILSILLFASCASEMDNPNLPGGGSINPGEAGETPLVFSVNVPGQANPQSYALSDMDENNVTSINVLVFKDNAGTMELADWAEAVAGSIQDDGASNKKKFKVNFSKLKKNSFNYQFVIIANGKEEVKDLFDVSGITVGAEKEATMALLKLENINRWLTDNTAANYLDIPMWGESPKQQVSDNMSITGLKLLRMVSKVNLTLDPLSGVQAKFILKSVRLYNYYKSGHLVPATANLETGSTSKVEKPTAVGTPTKGPIVYDATTTNGSIEATKLLENIYTFESPIALDNARPDLEKMTCLVIGGEYDGSGVETFYRLDFATQNAVTNVITYKHLLRNHNYKINITKVNGVGYDTDEEAFQSRAVNIEADIVAWDESEMNDTTFDGNYQLTVNKSEMEFYMEGRTQEMIIYTDHPNGWEIKAADKPAWLTITPMTGAYNNSTTIQVTATPILTSALPRNKEFWITAGKLKKKISVKQLNEAELTIDVTPTSLVFRKSGSNAKSIQVTTYPPTALVYFTEIQGINPMTWPPAGFPTTGLGNLGVYSFKPGINGTTNILSATVTVYVQDAKGNMVSKNITITQLATDLLFTATVANPYPAAGGNNLKFTVDSDTPWSILSVTDPKGALAGGFDNTLKAAGTGTIYNFSLNANNTWAPRNLSFVPTSSDPDFAGQPVVVRQNNINPSLVLDKTTIAFGATMTPAAQAIGVTSNAKWKITTSGDWLKVVNVAATTAEQGSHSYHTTSKNNVQFSPKAYTGVNGTPAAGTRYTATAIFTTSDHAPATAATTNATLARVVPAFFTYSSLGVASIGRVGGNVTVNATTNAAWKATPSTGTASADQAQTTYGNKSTTVNIPANTTWTGATTAANRIITVSTVYGGSTALMPIDGGDKTLTQPGYYISALARSLPTPAATGGTAASVTITGAFPAIATRAAINGTNTQVSNATPSVAAGESGARTANFTINANNTWAARAVVCQYQNPKNNNAWTTIDAAVNQAGYAITGFSATAVTASGGGNSTVYLTGYRPGINVRATNTQNGTINGTVGASTGAQGSTTLAIPANTSTTSSRTITISWYHPQTTQWNVITSFTQAIGNARLPSGKIVARQVIGPFNWAEAMGIDQRYITTLYPQYGVAEYTQDIDWTKGCAAYSEPGYPAGTWRLANANEYHAMRAIGVDMENRRYQCNGIDGTNNGNEPSKTVYAIFDGTQGANGGTVHSWQKFYLEYARCVRNP